jgi:UDP-N-acetylmuramoylalanine-D-glutamate ligase
MKLNKEIKVEPVEKEPFEIVLEKAIVEISAAFKKLESTRLSKKLIVALIYDDTKISKSTISAILESYKGLEHRYLKPKVEK